VSGRTIQNASTLELDRIVVQPFLEVCVMPWNDQAREAVEIASYQNERVKLYLECSEKTDINRQNQITTASEENC
jgi:hypothetical protein